MNRIQTVCTNYFFSISWTSKPFSSAIRLAYPWHWRVTETIDPNSQVPHITKTNVTLPSKNAELQQAGLLGPVTLQIIETK